MGLLKNIFGSKKDHSKIIFIVEDNAVYAQTLKAYLENEFPDAKEINIYPVGEVCVMNLHRDPAFIVMDYFLNTRFHDAETGLDTIKEIRAQKPGVHIALLSGQDKMDIALEAVKDLQCRYIKKDSSAFPLLAEFIRLHW